jgi:hypothetical protein
MNDPGAAWADQFSGTSVQFLRDERPLDPRVVNVGHADEPAAGQCCLPAAAVTKAELADEGRVPDVELMAAAKHFDTAEPEHVPALDPQHEDQPVRHVHQVLVSTGRPAKIVVSRL